MTIITTIEIEIHERTRAPTDRENTEHGRTLIEINFDKQAQHRETYEFPLIFGTCEFRYDGSDYIAHNIERYVFTSARLSIIANDKKDEAFATLPIDVRDDQRKRSESFRTSDDLRDEADGTWII